MLCRMGLCGATDFCEGCSNYKAFSFQRAEKTLEQKLKTTTLHRAQPGMIPSFSNGGEELRQPV